MSRQAYFLVVDVGTGSGRSLIFNQDGDQIAVAQREWTHRPDPRYPGSQDFDCVANWQSVCECIQQSLKTAGLKAADIEAVSATSMRQGIVCFDSVGKELFAVPNIDARADAETVELIEDGWGPKIYSIQGDWPSNHSLARMRWLKGHEREAFDRLAMVTMLSDWVLFRLTGEFCTEPSVASSSGMFDIAARDWSATLVELAGVEPTCVPRVLDPGMQLGRVTREAAEATGLAVDTPVIVGPADTQGAYVGTGVITPGAAGLVIGSFGLPAIVADKAILDPQKRVRTQCHAVPGQWIIESCSFYTGLALRWFRDAFCQEEIAQGQTTGRDPYDLMNERASRVPPGSYGVQVILSNVGNNSNWRHASPAFLDFDILDPQRYDKVTFYRALIENTAYQTLGELENIADVWGAWPEELAFSGGASKSALWAQILADTLNMPVKVPAVQEATALGTAAYAALAMAHYDNLDEVCSRYTRWAAIYQPDEDDHAIYRRAYERWREIYAHMLQLVEKDLARPMWKAPGT